MSLECDCMILLTDGFLAVTVAAKNGAIYAMWRSRPENPIQLPVLANCSTEIMIGLLVAAVPAYLSIGHLNLLVDLREPYRTNTAYAILASYVFLSW